MSLIYHHTTTDGLIGILESQAIWATDIKFLNDYEELLVGFEEIVSVIARNKESQKNASYTAEVAALYDSLGEILRENLLGRSTFIASFTKTRDNLRQWMSYGKPNSSYSLGFERSILENMPLDPVTHRSNDLAYSLKDVDYELDTLVSRSLNFDGIKTGLMRKPADEILHQVINDAMFGCCSIKRKQFSDENEVRMVLQTRKLNRPCSQSRFRNWGGVVTPYISVPIPMQSIKEIIIGPSTSRNLAEAGLTKLLQHKNMECKIFHSECTLRQY